MLVHNDSQSELEHPNLTPKQRRAIKLVATNNTDAEVAQKVGVNRETVNRWRRRNSDFQKAVEEYRKQLFENERIKMAENLSQFNAAIQKYLPKKYLKLANSYIELLANLSQE